MARADAKRERLDHKRALARARSKRHYRRAKDCKRIGRFTIDGELITALFWGGLITKAEAELQTGAESGVARLLDRFKADARKNVI